MFRLQFFACVCALWLATAPTATGDGSDAAQDAALADINRNLDLLTNQLETLTVSSTH